MDNLLWDRKSSLYLGSKNIVTRNQRIWCFLGPEITALEIELFDFWILLTPRIYHITHVPTAYSVPGSCMMRVFCTRRPSHKSTYDDSISRLLCARQVFVLTLTTPPQHFYHENHHSSSNTAAETASGNSSRYSSAGVGDLTSPTIVYVPDIKNIWQIKREIKNYQYRSEAIMDDLNFSCSLFWILKTKKKHQK